MDINLILLSIAAASLFIVITLLLLLMFISLRIVNILYWIETGNWNVPKSIKIKDEIFNC